MYVDCQDTGEIDHEESARTLKHEALEGLAVAANAPITSRPTMVDVDVDGPFDHSRLLQLLVNEGAGEEAVLRALGERVSDEAVVPGQSVAVDLPRKQLTRDVVLQLLLPFRAISEAAGEVPLPGGDSDDDSDSVNGSFGGGYSPSFSGLDGFASGSPLHLTQQDMLPEEAPAHAHADADTLVQTYIFPPSPLTALAQPASDDNPHAETAVQAARALCLVDPDAAALLQRTAHDLAANTVMLSPQWSAAFSRFEAVIEPCDRKVSDSTLVIRSVSDLKVSPAQVPLLHSLPSQQPSTPSRELLGLHAKMARILHETRAAAFVDALLSDNVHAEDLAGDGGTHAGLLMQLRLDGWWPAGRQKKKKTGTRTRTRTRDYSGRGGLDEVGTTMFWIEEARLVHEEEGVQSTA